jgi:hypothetical protein
VEENSLFSPKTCFSHFYSILLRTFHSLYCSFLIFNAKQNKCKNIEPSLIFFSIINQYEFLIKQSSITILIKWLYEINTIFACYIEYKNPITYRLSLKIYSLKAIKNFISSYEKILYSFKRLQNQNLVSITILYNTCINMNNNWNNIFIVTNSIGYQIRKKNLLYIIESPQAYLIFL